MNESTPLRLRAGGSVVLPADATEQDIDNAGRTDEADESTAQSPTEAAQPTAEEQP